MVNGKIHEKPCPPALADRHLAVWLVVAQAGSDFGCGRRLGAGVFHDQIDRDRRRAKICRKGYGQLRISRHFYTRAWRCRRTVVRPPASVVNKTRMPPNKARGGVGGDVLSTFSSSMP